jgi:hypothetical protein
MGQCFRNELFQFQAIRDILPPPSLKLRGGGFSAKNTSVFRLPELIGFPVPQGTMIITFLYRSAVLSASVFRFIAAL